MSLERRLQIGFATVLAAAVLVGMTAIGVLTLFDRQVQELIDEELPLAALHEELLQALTEAETAERGFLITGQEVSLAPFAPSVARFRAASERALTATADPTIRQLLEREISAGEGWVEGFATPIVELRAEDEQAALEQARTGAGRIRFAAFRVAHDATATAIDDRLDEREALTRRVATGAQLGLGGLLLAAVGLVVVVGRHTIGATTGPLRRLTGDLQELRGDRHVRVDAAHGPPEVREVATAVNELAEANERFAEERQQVVRATAGARPAEVRLRGHRLARAADAADEHHRVPGDARRRGRRRAHQRAAGTAGRRPAQRGPPPGAHRGHADAGADRVGCDASWRSPWTSGP